MKKQWISVKCGLSRDPKHRQQMGESVWLFLHILDRTDWESGKVLEWKDEAEADEMGMPVRTLREHRRKLEELEYISCAQKQYGQEITIHNWTNPREYSGVVLNKKQGDMETSPQSYTQDDMQGYTQGNRKDVTPTYNSKNQTSNITEAEKSEIIQSANKTVDFILENEKKVRYQNREKFSESLLPFADLYNQLTTQEPTKRVLLDWLQTFDEWKSEGLNADHIRAAWQYANRPEGGFMVGRPGALTNTAVAMKTKMLVKPVGPAIDRNDIERTKQMLAEKEVKAVPMPEHLRKRMSQLTERMSTK